jgi:hypothetical protein
MLRGGRSGVRIPVAQEIFSAGSGTHPASYSEGTWGFRWGLKQPGRDVYRQPPSSAADNNQWGCTTLNTIPSCRGHGFDIWQGERIVKVVTKPRMWTPSMFRHNGVMFGCRISITGTVESKRKSLGLPAVSVP